MSHFCSRIFTIISHDFHQYVHHYSSPMFLQLGKLAGAAPHRSRGSRPGGPRERGRAEKRGFRGQLGRHQRGAGRRGLTVQMSNSWVPTQLRWFMSWKNPTKNMDDITRGTAWYSPIFEGKHHFDDAAWYGIATKLGDSCGANVGIPYMEHVACSVP